MQVIGTYLSRDYYNKYSSEHLLEHYSTLAMFNIQLNRCILLCTVFVLICNGIEADSTFKVKLNVKGQFVDDFGRVRMFHGFNSVQKSAPWYDYQILNETRLRMFSQWGFNIVRLGSMWTGYQPTESEYNATYISIMTAIVKKLRSFGIYSLLDMHQDVISSKFDTYDGVPLWLIDKFPKVPEELKFPFPLRQNITHYWGDYYMTYEAAECYQSLYSTEIGIENWVKLWAKVASIFSTEDSVIGYELINEPWVGNFYTDPRRMMPGYAGRVNLLPVYDRIVRKIREIDDETLIFYEPVTFGVYVPSTGDFGTGFDRVPGGVNETLRSVLSYHYYCLLILSGNASTNYPNWKKTICDNISGKQVFESVISNVKVTGGGSLLTEFGGCEPDGNELSINTIECDAVLKLADSHFQSYTYWDSQFFDNNGNPRVSVIRTFARAYPRAVQGQPISYSFDRISGTMELVYAIDLSIQAPTEIFLPVSVHYGKGFLNQTAPAMSTRFDPQSFLLYVSPASVNITQGTIISIKIVPIY